jgi:hypothetical protein
LAGHEWGQMRAGSLSMLKLEEGSGAAQKKRRWQRGAPKYLTLRAGREEIRSGPAHPNGVGLLKKYHQPSYEKLAFHREDSASFRAFARLPCGAYGVANAWKR